MIGQTIAMNYEQPILDGYDDIIDELLLLFEFYTPYDWDGGDPLKIYYKIRPYGNMASSRRDKLEEVFRLFSMLFRFLFMEEGHSSKEITFGLDRFEMEYIGNSESLEDDIEIVFDLGKCWGEYISTCGISTSELSLTEKVHADGEPTHKKIARLEYLRSRRSYGSTKGAAGNSRIGRKSKAAYGKFVEDYYPNGLEGRTKKFVQLDCLAQIERLVILENRVLMGVTLNPSQEIERERLRYLIALTKLDGGKFRPYSLNTIASGLKNFLKK